MSDYHKVLQLLLEHSVGNLLAEASLCGYFSKEVWMTLLSTERQAAQYNPAPARR